MDIVSSDIPQGKHYVYTLAYPDGRVFYVGKGTGERIDRHEWEAKRSQRSNYKLNTIRKIWASGGEVVKTKLAHFKTHKEACMYEIALIFFMDGLTNRTNGGDGVWGLPPWNKGHKGQVPWNKGKAMPEETKRKVSESKTGQHVTFTEEHRYNLKMSPKAIEQRRKLSEFHKGKIRSEETRRKMRAAQKGHPGRPLSEEHKRKLLEANKSREYPPLSEERKRKLNDAHTGRPLSEEHRRKLSKANKGRKRSTDSQSAP